MAVRGYCSLPLSAAQVVRLLAESNIDVSARTVLNWVQTFGPQLAATLRKEFAKLLGAQALYRCFVTLPVTNSVKFLEKMYSHSW